MVLLEAGELEETLETAGISGLLTEVGLVASECSKEQHLLGPNGNASGLKGPRDLKVKTWTPAYFAGKKRTRDLNLWFYQNVESKM